MSFGHLVHAEWTKFRTVRGWLIGILLAGVVTIGIGLLGHSQCGGTVVNGTTISTSACTVPLGPGGEAVTDGAYLVHQALGPDGTVTARVTAADESALPWSKAGIIVKASLTSGSAYAAMMVTGQHGVRMQWDYTHDMPGLAGAVSAASPRWLRLVRSGDTLTGYDSLDGTHWLTVGTVTLAGLPATVQAGPFAASPGQSSVTSQSVGGGSSAGRAGAGQVTARFDHMTVTGAARGVAWAGTDLSGRTPGDGYQQAGGVFTLTGSGDIAPYIGGDSVSSAIVGTFAGLITVVVIGAIFITTEYRRGLIRLTLAASPRRNRVLAAKAVVIGAVTFAVALPSVYAALLLGEWRQRSGGIFIDPVPVLTEVRIIVGTAVLLAVAAVLALGVGTVARRGAAAVTAVIVAIVLPYFFASPLALLPAGAADWLLRLTPAAAFAVQQAYPEYPQVATAYTPQNDYYPLAWWVGLAVLCAWAALALTAAMYLLNRRDA